MKNYNENGELMYITIYIYIGWNTIYEKTIYPDLTETETKYIYGASGHMAKITDTGTVETTTFYHTDVLGSVRQKTDSDGQALWVSIAIYKPFGGIYSGGPADESETHLYTGKTYDYGTGLYYYGARFYDPEVGRFVTKDLVEGFLVLPQTFNPYTYGYNNPLRGSDPDGMAPLWMLIAILILAIAYLINLFWGDEEKLLRESGEYNEIMLRIIKAYGYQEAPNAQLEIQNILMTLNNMIEAGVGGDPNIDQELLQNVFDWFWQKNQEAMTEEELDEFKKEVYDLEEKWREEGHFIDINGDGWIGVPWEPGSLAISDQGFYWIWTGCGEEWEMVGECPAGMTCEPPNPPPG